MEVSRWRGGSCGFETGRTPSFALTVAQQVTGEPHTLFFCSKPPIWVQLRLPESLVKKLAACLVWGARLCQFLLGITLIGISRKIETFDT